ncbi:MAG: Protein-L-isoaspartate O-methyltransferase [Ignavibacteriae bacterium]|nr:MAG: Protein-L-isoaspartate O-methyltransferase [Ignavibacteriota bacterium]
MKVNIKLLLLIGFGFIVYGLKIVFQDEYFNQRNDMVKYQIQQRGIRDTNVIKAMLTVPRHEFVSKKYISQAYADHPLPIGYGKKLKYSSIWMEL